MSITYLDEESKAIKTGQGATYLDEEPVDPLAIKLTVIPEPEQRQPVIPPSAFDETGIVLPKTETLLEQLPEVVPLTAEAAETATFAAPPSKGFVDGLVEGARKATFIPFSDVTELTDMAFVLSAVKRIEAGTETYEDENIVDDFLRQSQQPATTGYKIAQGLMRLPAFAGELALTAGVYTGAKTVVGRSLTKVLARYAESKAGKAVLATLPRLAGVAAQTPAARAPAIAAGAIERTLPTIQLNPDEASELNFTIQNDEDGVVKAFAKSFTSQMIEVGTERAGNLLDKLPAGQIFQAAIARYLRINPTKRIADFMAMTRNKALRNSFIAETIEEEIAKPLHVLLGTETGLRGKENTWSNRFREQYNLENYLVQTAVLSVPTAGGVALQRFASPRNLRPEYRASVKEQISLLNEVSGKLKDAGNTYGVDVIEKAVANIKESGNRLTNRGVENVLRVANQQKPALERPVEPQKTAEGVEIPPETTLPPPTPTPPKRGVIPPEIPEVGVGALPKETAKEQATRLQAQEAKLEEMAQELPAKPEVGVRVIPTEGVGIVGKPELAVPAVTPEGRELFRAVDQREKELGAPAIRRDVEVTESARKIYFADPRAAQLKVLTRQIKYDNDVQVRVAKMALNDMATQGMLQSDNEKISEAIVGKILWRQAGTEQARAFRARADEAMSPEQRMAEALQNALLYPNSAIAKTVEGLDFKSAVEAVGEAAKETQKRRARLIIELGIDPANLDEATLKDPYKLAALTREAQLANANWGDIIYEYWRNGILAGIPTQGANIIGNTGNLSWNYTFQRLAEATVNMMVRAPNAPTFKEIGFMYKHIYPAILRANKNALIGFATEQPVLEGQKVEEKGIAIPGILGRGIRLPQRFLLMADEAAKGVIYQMEIASLAYRQATTEGLNNQEEAFYQRIENLMAVPSAEMHQKALDEARRLTFQEELQKTSLGHYAKAIMGWREAGGIGGWIARFMFPFVKTPTNIITQGMRASPFGLLRMARKAAKGEYRGLERRTELVRDAAQQVLAATVTSVIWALVSGDDDDVPWITGSRKSYQRRGEQAYQYKYRPPQSFRVGNRWVSYSRIEPFATAITPIIDMIYLMKSERELNWETASETLMNTTKAQIRDKTFLQGIGDIVKVMEDDRRLRGIGESFLSSWNPNIIRTTMRATDDYIRQFTAKEEGFWKTTGRKILPSSAFQAPPRQDIWGQPLEKGEGWGPATDFMVRSILPIRFQRVTEPFNLDRMIKNWNNDAEARGYKEWWPELPSNKYERREKGKPVQKVMDADTYYKYIALRGKTALRIAKGLHWNYDNPNEIDIRRLRNIFGRASEIAKIQIERSPETTVRETELGKRLLEQEENELEE